MWPLKFFIEVKDGGLPWMGLGLGSGLWLWLGLGSGFGMGIVLLGPNWHRGQIWGPDLGSEVIGGGGQPGRARRWFWQ